MAGFLNRCFGLNSTGDSTPVFDGALRPNQDLDLCRLLARDLDDPDDVAVVKGVPVVGCGNRLIEISGHWFAPQRACVATFDDHIGALAALTDGLAVSVGEKEIVILGGRHEGKIELLDGRPPSCITAMTADGDRLLVAQGSRNHARTQWRRDLFERNSSGRIIEIDLVSRNSAVIAEELAWPSGICLAFDGRIVFSEAWRHRVVVLDGAGRRGGRLSGLDDIPGYPGRLIRTETGYWLSCFAVRTQLTDFVLADKAFSRRMMDEIDEPYWIAPSLCSTDHPLEPTQIGGIKQFGVKKPWAPARSYGLVVKLDEEMEPIASLHSRVDGKRHGITGLAAAGERLFIVSKGHGKVLMHEEVEL